MSYRVYGRVRRTDNGQGIPNLKVTAYDVDWISSDDYLGQATTNTNGDFDIYFNKSDFDAGWFDLEGGPDVVVRAYSTSGNLIYKSPERSGAGKQTYFDIRIDPLDLIGEYTVAGVVRDARTSRALCNLLIEAWDDDFIFDDKLGSTVQTDVQGRYLVPYTKSSFSGGWFSALFEGNPDVYVKVKNNAGSVLARSHTLYEAARHSNIDVYVGGQEISRSVSECVYGWTAAYRQEGTHVIVRIHLDPDSDVTAQETQTLMTTWKQGIENKWGNRFACCCSNTAKSTLSCPNWGALTFEVQWVTTNPHHTVRIRRGPSRTNMLCWDTGDTGDVASHEFGHMLGLVDEYSDSVCPARSPVNTGNVMDDNTEVVERHVEHLCQILNENAVPIIQLQILEALLKARKAIAKKEVKLPVVDNSALMRVRKEFTKKIQAVVKGEAKPDKTIKITHIISGGPPGKRIDSKVEILGNGDVTYTIKDENKKEEYTTKLTEKTVKNLLKDIDTSGLLDLEEVGGGFLPDSTVGMITIEFEGKVTNFVYLADPEQRRDQKKMVKQAVASVELNLRRLTEVTKKRDKKTQERIKSKLLKK